MAMKTIGERIRVRRLQLGMSAKELAARAGIAASTLTELEKGDSKGSKHLHRIAEELGVAPLELDPPKRRRLRPAADGHMNAATGQQGTDPIQKNIVNESRLQRLDPAMILNGFVAVEAFFKFHESEFKVDTDPDLLARAYEFEQTHDSALLRSIEADVAARVAERQGANRNERGSVAQRQRRARKR